jgi:hypothetical protein
MKLFKIQLPDRKEPYETCDENMALRAHTIGYNVAAMEMDDIILINHNGRIYPANVDVSNERN